MRRSSRPTREQRRYYGKLVGCVVVRVLWDKLGGQPLPVLIVSTPGGGTAECVVMRDVDGKKPGHLRHCI